MNERPEINRQSLAVAGSTMIATLCSSLVFAMIAIAVFMDQMAADYGWGRGAIGAAVTVLHVGTAISSRIFGPLVDRMGPRAISLPLIVVSGLILASFSLIERSLPVFYVAHFLLGMTSPGAVAHSKLISSWFFRRRGIALTVMAIGAAIAQVALPPLARTSMLSIGWHGTYLLFAAAGLAIGLPILLAFYREPKRANSPEAHGGGEVRPDGAPPILIRQAMATRTYWLIVLGQVAAILAYTGIGTHAVGILAEHGVAPEYRVLGLSLLAFGSLAAQLGIGILLDVFDTPRIVAPFALTAVAGVGVILFSEHQTMALAGILLFGVGCGGETAITSYFISRYFGVRNFSSIYGSLFLLFLTGSSGSIIAGAMFDTWGTYDPGLLVLGGCLMVTFTLILFLGPYPYPVRNADFGPAETVPPTPPSADGVKQPA